MSCKTKISKWIWLDPMRFRDRQASRYTGNWSNECADDTVAQFSRTYTFNKKIEYIELCYSADAVVQLWINGRFLGTGPVSSSGDFCGNDRPRANRYFSKLTLVPDGADDHLSRTLTILGLERGRIEISARVRLNPTGISDFSIGRGGFNLEGKAYFYDGTEIDFGTDGTWNASLCPAYYTPCRYDGTLEDVDAGFAAELPDLWHATPSPLPHRVEARREPDGGIIKVAPGSTVKCSVDFGKIYAAYLSVAAKARGKVTVKVKINETENDTAGGYEELIFVKDYHYIGTVMHSAGVLTAEIVNESEHPAEVSLGINEAYLPYRIDARTETDLDWLNRVLDVCRHTLKYCRQYTHLDSPRHCEPLACTGDYFIETLMTSYSFADMALADFDVVRTARIIEHNDGVMFHPTYSLIWVRMLREVYMRCARLGLLTDCKTALSKLLSVFDGYVGNEGLLDTPPSFMFVDWIVVDGFSLHHPPKALGQSVMNMFYYDALLAASDIFHYLGDEGRSKEALHRAVELKENINRYLYDNERGMYCEGLNTPTPEHLIGNYMPKNTEKRYFRINANALAVAFGIIEGDAARALMRRLLDDPSFSDYQPYFAHFVLQAVHRAGLDGEYLLPILEKWRTPIEECPRGLAEGFIPPEPGYAFDHSHAWGGTPLYSLPTALCSLEILEPGMRHISIRPQLCGLDKARVEIPTPNGTVVCDINKDGATVTAPRAVTVDVLSS